MATKENLFAIVNGVKTNRKVIAICEWATYDVWGNAKEGYQVNDTFRQGEIEIEAEVTVCGMPRLPGAHDRYRKFPKDCASFSCDMSVGFVLSDEAIKSALSFRCRISVDGDGTNYYINRESDDMPLAEIRIVGWKDENGDGPEPSEDVAPVLTAEQQQFPPQFP